MSTEKFYYAAQVSYLGTSYCGWQWQKKSESGGRQSIQEKIEETLRQIHGVKINVAASGRTDAGVHALGQVISFQTPKEWEIPLLQKAMNAILPRDIRVLVLKKVSPEFHPTRSAGKKQYSYFIQQGPAPIPHLNFYSWWIRRPLEVSAMQTALNFLKGEHDFRAFQASGATTRSTVRTLLEAEVTRQSPPTLGAIPVSSEYSWIQIRVVGTGFLKQMVRGIVGTLNQIGDGRRSPDEMKLVLDQKDRSLVGPTAPPQGLWLERVWYPDFPDLFC